MDGSRVWMEAYAITFESEVILGPQSLQLSFAFE